MMNMKLIFKSCHGVKQMESMDLTITEKLQKKLKTSKTGFVTQYLPKLNLNVSPAQILGRLRNLYFNLWFKKKIKRLGTTKNLILKSISSLEFGNKNVKNAMLTVSTKVTMMKMLVSQKLLPKTFLRGTLQNSETNLALMEINRENQIWMPLTKVIYVKHANTEFANSQTLEWISENLKYKWMYNSKLKAS